MPSLDINSYYLKSLSVKERTWNAVIYRGIIEQETINLVGDGKQYRTGIIGKGD